MDSKFLFSKIGQDSQYIQDEFSNIFYKNLGEKYLTNSANPARIFPKKADTVKHCFFQHPYHVL